MQGFLTLFRKELMRFCKVGLQTIAAPMLSALLYLLIFSHALSGHVAIYPGVAYTSFLVPGLVMMALMQNAFGNSSSSLIQSKVSGNLVFVLLAPLTPLAMYGGYVLSAMVRGLVVGAGVAAIWAEKFDQIASFQNFLVVPLTFLSGVFYSVHSLPPFWQVASHANPFFYMVDGFRYAFFGQADIDPWLSLGIVAAAWLLLALLAMRLLHRGYHLRY